MKRIFVSLFCVSLSALVLILGFTRLTSDVSAQPSRQIETVILTCDKTPRPILEVNSYTGSGRALSIPLGTNCAQALADLLNNGFKIRKVSRNLLMYTLIKADHNWVWM